MRELGHWVRYEINQSKVINKGLADKAKGR